MKKVIYTCLFGNYDILLQPLVVDDSFDYVCFSNDFEEKKNGVWEIRKLSVSQKHGSSWMSRYAKIQPHRVLQEYDFSVYIDANIQIIDSSFYDIINKRIEEGHLVNQVPHLISNCIYDEIRKTYFAGRVSWKEAKLHYRHLMNNNFPEQYGLFENNIILRKHNDKSVVVISEAWWNEYINYSKRDQFSLMYVYWKFHYTPSYIFDSRHNTRNVECLKYHHHVKAGMWESHLNWMNRDNPLRIIGRFFHTLSKNMFIKLFLNH